MGLVTEPHFINYHRVLSRAIWSSRAASQILLLQLGQRFSATGTIVVGIDDTIERRRGKHIVTKSIYRDPVHSSNNGGGTWIHNGAGGFSSGIVLAKNKLHLHLPDRLAGVRQ
jgi:hypothetical protein